MSVGQPKRELSPPIIICNYLFFVFTVCKLTDRKMWIKIA